MNRVIVAILLSLCTLTCRAQQPLLTTQWTQDSPYNQHCPADPLENNKHSYAWCPYGWTKIEGIIVNIIPTIPPLAVSAPSQPHSLEVYPNPATDCLFLRGLPSEAVDYTIFNFMGHQVAAGSTTGVIPVAELGGGLYLLRIDGDGRNETVKFVVR